MLSSIGSRRQAVAGSSARVGVTFGKAKIGASRVDLPRWRSKLSMISTICFKYLFGLRMNVVLFFFSPIFPRTLRTSTRRQKFLEPRRQEAWRAVSVNPVRRRHEEKGKARIDKAVR